MNVGLLTSAPARAQGAAPTISEVRVEQEGEVVTDPLVLGLIETKVGMPVSVASVRESIAHLSSLTRYEDVQVYEEPAAAGGVRLRYVLLPIHAVDKLEFRGTLGLPEGDLRKAIVERFGPARRRPSRAEDVARALQFPYRDRGYLEPSIAPGIEISHKPDRASMVLQIDSGARALIKAIEFDAMPDDRNVFAGTAIAAGQPYDAAVIQAQLQKTETMPARPRCATRRAPASHKPCDYVGNGADQCASLSDRGPCTCRSPFRGRSCFLRRDQRPASCRSRRRDPPTRICSRTPATRSRTTSTRAAIATRWPRTSGTRVPMAAS